jgi:hypothetical protein
MQDGERQFHLGLNTRRPDNPAVRRALLHVVQQDGLADACLTAQDQHPAVTRTHLVQQPVQNRLLAISTTQCLVGHDIRAILVVCLDIPYQAGQPAMPPESPPGTVGP